jgi:hypothetical protein
MNYFGEPWPSGICDDANARQVPVPVGESCVLCDDLIISSDQGSFMGALVNDKPAMAPVHRECSLRSVLGGIGHHVDHEYWCEVFGDPDGGQSYRRSALMVWELRHTGVVPSLPRLGG